MDLSDYQRWCRERGRAAGRIARAEPGVVPGWRLVWNYYSRVRQGGAANVEPAPGAELHGLALEVDAEALSAIDHKEGHPGRYRRGPGLVRVDLKTGERVQAWLYVVLPEFRQEGYVAPRREYRDLIVSVGEARGFPAEYLEGIRGLRSAD